MRYQVKYNYDQYEIAYAIMHQLVYGGKTCRLIMHHCWLALCSSALGTEDYTNHTQPVVH